MEKLPDNVVLIMNEHLKKCIQKREKNNYNEKYQDVINKAYHIIQNTNDSLEKVYDIISNREL
jgi:hypothetical protein